MNGVIPSITGLSWLDDREMAMSVNSMTGNILCKLHNEALTGFDAVGTDLFSEIDQVRRDEPRTNKVRLFNGHDIERWLLKTLCALVFSGNACSTVARSQLWRPNLFWLSVLFLNQPLPVSWGLYWSARGGGSGKQFEYSVLSNATDGVYGMMATFSGQQLTLAMAHPRPGSDLLNACIYRPAQIIFRGNTAETVLMFGWDVPARGQQITFAVNRVRPVTD